MVGKATLSRGAHICHPQDIYQKLGKFISSSSDSFSLGSIVFIASQDFRIVMNYHIRAGAGRGYNGRLTLRKKINGVAGHALRLSPKAAVKGRLPATGLSLGKLHLKPQLF